MPDEIRISAQEANEKVRRGDAALLDVVGDGAWRALREVPAGAIRLAPSEARERIASLPRAKAFAVFCT